MVQRLTVRVLTHLQDDDLFLKYIDLLQQILDSTKPYQRISYRAAARDYGKELKRRGLL